MISNETNPKPMTPKKRKEIIKEVMAKCECKLNHEASETCDHAKQRFELLMKGVRASQSGYGGMLPSGQIVDRREYPDAAPISENSMFKIPKPKEVNQ